MFIGRTKELAMLNSLYTTNRFEFAVIYGRRRVGKTALINKLIANKKAIYFMGVESSESQNLENLSRSIMECCHGINVDTSFSSFQAALEYVFQVSQRERLILAIDEYPYVARASKSLPSTLQMLIDKYKDSSQLMLVLCGSSMSYMEDQVLAYKAPLYGRRTAQLKLEPFDFFDTCNYLARLGDQDKALAYGMVGGTPQYLLQLQDTISIEENIKRTFLNPANILFEEPENLLKQEVREPALYNAIITAIATGSSRLAEICTKVGETSSTCSAYLKSLMALGIVHKETPYGEKESRKSIYIIADNMFKFWYRFIPSNSSMISRGGGDLVYKRIEAQLADYMGQIFEEICRQYLWKRLLEGKAEVEFNDLGRWWGTDPHTRSQTEIDIMGVLDKETALFGECKWTNEKVDVGVLDKLLERSRLFSYANVHLYLFAKAGFTKGCVEKAALMEHVYLVNYADILECSKEEEK